jgi:hypothetical protein
LAGSCEHGNETFGSIKGEEFLDTAELLSASQEVSSNMELVRMFRNVVCTFILHRNAKKKKIRSHDGSCFKARIILRQ